MTDMSSAGANTENRFTLFCLKGLENIYIPSEHVFAASIQLVNGKMVHVRDRNLEFRFTMNTLMGLHRIQMQGAKVFLDIESDYHGMEKQIEEHTDSPLDIAATVWTGKCLGTEVPPEALSSFRNLLSNAPQMRSLGPKALAWSIAACLTGGTDDYKHALTLAKLAAERYIHPVTGLVRQEPFGLRRNWSPFGAQSYMAFAFLHLARKTGNDWARDIGLRTVRRLVQLQGENGQWGWMYHVPTGKVADYYPVFSVHQYAYAPFFLLEAIEQGYEEFREPLMKGFRWILGQNEMGQSMVEPARQIVWRRIIRKKGDSKLTKLLRALGSIYGGFKSGTIKAHRLDIDRQCWGFEMALPLCVFSGRNDFPEFLDDKCFS
jgi:hypothetical protein